MKTSLILLTLGVAFATIVPVADAVPSAQEPRHFIVAVSTGLIPAQNQDVFTLCMDLLLNRAKPGDHVEFLAAPQGGCLASVTVPDGSARARANSREYAGKFGALKQFLSTATRSPARQAGQLCLPELLDAVARSHASHEPWTVIVVGSPLYFAANEREAAFDMEKGLVPGDGMIAASVTESLFGTIERKGQLRDMHVHWLTPTEEWAAGEMHRHSVTRFWSLFLSEQGAVLSTFSSDAGQVFQRAEQGEVNPVMNATLDKNDRGLIMRPPPIFRRESAPPVEARISAPAAQTHTQTTASPSAPPVSVSPPIHNLLGGSPAIAKATSEIPLTPVNHIGIAAVWEAAAQAASTADVDLYVAAHPGDPEVFWKHAEAPGAVYFRDIRHAGPQGNGSNWTACWEYVEVMHNQLEDVSLWLNIFDTKAPVKGIIRVQHNGRSVDKPFQFNVNCGNHGQDNGASQRRQSPFWQEVKLSDLFPGEIVIRRPNR